MVSATHAEYHRTDSDADRRERAREKAWALFRDGPYIAIGPAGVGDLNDLTDRRELVARTRRLEPEGLLKTAGAAAKHLGWFRFDIDGAIVVVKNGRKGAFGIGRIVGPYEYKPGQHRTGIRGLEGDSAYPHVRSVAWEKTRPRTLAELGLKSCPWTTGAIDARRAVPLWARQWLEDANP